MSGTDKSLHFSPEGPATGSLSAAEVPRYSLYGDDRPRSDWFVNVERLDSRCRERGWIIAPHTHPRFAQVMVCLSGGGEATIEGSTHDFARGSVVIVPPFRIHGFRYMQEADGWILTIEANYLTDLLNRSPALKAVLQEPGVFVLDEPVLPEIEAQVAQLSRELHNDEDGAAIGSEIHLLSVLLLFLRHFPIRPSENGANGGRQRLVERYRAIVEARYRDQPALPDVAAELGVSVSQLRQACQTVMGLAPIAILHDRILSEAKRCLAYTGLGVTEIADYLGFTDGAYFSRFFSKATSSAPTAYRRAHAASPLANPPQDRSS